ncbi:hypothetical protein KFK09_013869 [Dendrobium nobile]|uniref:DUF4283 domain-containing protein n=1 Tax=Dendrobium nobile TaxID=94219 RepID=A0A8T3BAE1_DENNO|nr:hypothetical protein KFK09_013869 [Dendrobium nobile]
MDPSLNPSSFPPLPNSTSTALASSSTPLPWDRVFSNPPPIGEFNISPVPTPDEIIDFPTLDIADAVEEWNLALVGYSLGNRPYYGALLNAVKRLWELKGNIKLISFSDGFFLFKFSCREDFDMVWNKGAWFIFGKPFIFRKWTSHFSPKREEFTSVPIWFKIHDLPLCCWTPVEISKIATKIGSPVAVDSLTASKSRLTYARVCVLVDSSASYPATVPITVEGKHFNLVIEYEWRPSTCEICKSFNHSSNSCPSNPNPTVSLPPKPPRGRSSSRKPRPQSRNPSRLLPPPQTRISPSPEIVAPTQQQSPKATDLPNVASSPDEFSPEVQVINAASGPTASNPQTGLLSNPAIILNLNSPTIPSTSSSDQPVPQPSLQNQDAQPSSSAPKSSNLNSILQDSPPPNSTSPNKFNLLQLLADSEVNSNNNLEDCINEHSHTKSSSYSPPPNNKQSTAISSSKKSDQPIKNKRGKGTKKGPKSNSKS